MTGIGCKPVSPAHYYQQVFTVVNSSDGRKGRLQHEHRGDKGRKVWSCQLHSITQPAPAFQR